MLPDWQDSDLQAVAPLLDQAASIWGVDRDVLYAVAGQESRYVASAINTNDVPPSYGVMQLQLPTAQGQGYSGNDPAGLLDPATNINFGAGYLAGCIAKYGQDDGIAAYNGGYIGGQIVGSANEYLAAVQSRIAYFDALWTTGSVPVTASGSSDVLVLGGLVAALLLWAVLT